MTAANLARCGEWQASESESRKVLTIAEGLHGNHSRGKAIFACREQGIWRELDVPPRPDQSQIRVNSRFHLRPLVDANSGLPRTCIALVNRKKARIFELQEKEITRVGSNQAVPVNARIIVATHKNLLEEVQRKTFREDLYFRLNVITVEMPPLRVRSADLVRFAQHYLKHFAALCGRRLDEFYETTQTYDAFQGPNRMPEFWGPILIISWDWTATRLQQSTKSRFVIRGVPDS